MSWNIGNIGATASSRGPAAVPEEDEENICRVCRCSGTSDQPLFHPCLCSGSIKFIHQDCLTTWLEHSQKRYCELCKHPFTFSPIYDERMPMALPLDVFLTGIVKRFSGIVGTWLRYLFVFSVWLLGLPYCTFQSWKYFFGGIPDDYLFGFLLNSKLDDQASSNTPVLHPWFQNELFSFSL